MHAKRFIDTNILIYAFSNDQSAIARAIVLLKFFPNTGRPGSVKTREKPVKSLPYVIVYTAEDGELAVLRVYHGAQDRP